MRHIPSFVTKTSEKKERGPQMDRLARISEVLAPLRAAYPAGFAIALHFNYAAPKYLFQSYRTDWMDIYSREGLVLHDPTVRWGLAHTGSVRWSALDPGDEAGVMARAAEHGMRFGVALALDTNGSRSVANFARPDHEVSAPEIARLGDDLAILHGLTATLETVTPQFHDSLRRMSIHLTRGPKG